MNLKNIQSTLILGLGLALAPAFGLGSISGTVLDSTSQPGAVITVPYAVVKLQKPLSDTSFSDLAMDTTDMEGSFSFPDLEDGVYSLFTSSTQYKPDRRAVTVSGGAPAVIETRLALIPIGSLTGFVYVDGETVYGATMEAMKDGEVLFSEASASNGLYFFYFMMEIGVTYQIRCSYDGAISKTAEHTQINDEDELDFYLESDTGQAGAAIPSPLAGAAPVVRVAGPGLLHLDGAKAPGTLALFGLDGAALWQTSFAANTTSLALPPQLAAKKNVFIVRVQQKSGTYCRKIALP